jgi:ABC-2 type transporter
MMLTMFTESISNASFGIYMPKWTGTIYEMLSAPLSPLETVIAYVGAAATKSVIIGSIIFATAHLFVDVQVVHPFWMVAFMILMAVTFCLFGFIIGIWAQSFEQLQVIPLLVVYPLTFLGGAFYSLDMLPAAWRTITLFNPVVYLISGFRWTFFGQHGRGRAFPDAVPGRDLLDVPDGVPAQELSRARRCLGAASAAVEPLAHFLAGLEIGHVFRLHVDRRARTRVAAGARVAAAGRKGAEAAQFDASARCELVHYGIEENIDDLFHLFKA